MTVLAANPRVKAQGMRLHIAQPSLSVQIRKLELSLGTRLLIRSSRSASLTSAGDVLLGEATRLLSAAERVVR